MEDEVTKLIDPVDGVADGEKVLSISRKDLDIMVKTAISESKAESETKLADNIQSLKEDVVSELKETASKITNIHERIEDDNKFGYKLISEFAVDIRNLAVNQPTSEIFKKWTSEEKRAIVTGKGISTLSDIEIKTAGDGLSVTVDSEGGVLVPPGFSKTLMEVGMEENDIINRLTPVPMANASVEMPYIKDTDRSGGAIFGSVTTAWLDEVGGLTASKIKTGKITLNIHTLGGMVYVTERLLKYSSISLEPILTIKFPQAISWAITQAVINGTGANQPLGMSKAPCKVEINAVDGQAANTIEFRNIVDMYARIPSWLRKNMIWLANDDCIPEILSMTLTGGTAQTPVFMPANGISGLPYDTILGKPLIFTEHCESLGTAGDIMAIVPSEYLLGQPSDGTSFASSIHLKFDYNQIAYKFTMDVDGQPWWPSSLVPRKSSNALSPIIILEDR